MKRRAFFGGALAGMSITGAYAAPPRVKEGDIRTTTFGKTGIEVSVIAQGGARMDLHPDVPSAHVRKVYDLGVTYFDCSRLYWDGRAEESYGIGLSGVRKNVFLTSKTIKRTAKEAEEELQTSFRLLKTDHLDLWQVHAVQTLDDIQKILAPGGAMEAFEAAKKAGKCRFIGFTGHFDPEVHAALLKAYDKWDTVMMPIHAADHAYLSFEKTALPVAIERGVGTQAIKVFGKAYLLRSLSPTECLAPSGRGSLLIGQSLSHYRIAAAVPERRGLHLRRDVRLPDRRGREHRPRGSGRLAGSLATLDRVGAPAPGPPAGA